MTLQVNPQMSNSPLHKKWMIPHASWQSSLKARAGCYHGGRFWDQGVGRDLIGENP